LPMLDLLSGAMQNHHPGILAAFKRALRNQFPWQNVTVIAKSCAHRSIESSADPRRNSALDSCIADANVSQRDSAELLIGERICTKARGESRCPRDDNRS